MLHKRASTHLEVLNAGVLAPDDGLDVRLVRGGIHALVLQRVHVLKDLMVNVSPGQSPSLASLRSKGNTGIFLVQLTARRSRAESSALTWNMTTWVMLSMRLAIVLARDSS